MRGLVAWTSTEQLERPVDPRVQVDKCDRSEPRSTEFDGQRKSVEPGAHLDHQSQLQWPELDRRVRESGTIEEQARHCQIPGRRVRAATGAARPLRATPAVRGWLPGCEGRRSWPAGRRRSGTPEAGARGCRARARSGLRRGVAQRRRESFDRHARGRRVATRSRRAQALDRGRWRARRRCVCRACEQLEPTWSCQLPRTRDRHQSELAEEPVEVDEHVGRIPSRTEPFGWRHGQRSDTCWARRRARKRHRTASSMLPTPIDTPCSTGPIEHAPLDAELDKARLDPVVRRCRTWLHRCTVSATDVHPRCPVLLREPEDGSQRRETTAHVTRFRYLSGVSLTSPSCPKIDPPARAYPGTITATSPLWAVRAHRRETLWNDQPSLPRCCRASTPPCRTGTRTPSRN